MRYEKICKGQFIARPNRFVAHVLIDGKEEKVHVKNTGRCRELLVPGCTVFLEDFEGRMGTRKMRYSLVAVLKGSLMINMDSQAPNKVCEEALSDGRIKLPGLGKLTLIKREKTFGNSRFDFYLEDEDGQCAYAEVKGVTLENSGIARFPDAPTERGVKHIHELIEAKKEGYYAAIIFAVQMKGIEHMEPNDETHKAFGDALRLAESEGVGIFAYDCIVTEDTLSIDREIPVLL